MIALSSHHLYGSRTLFSVSSSSADNGALCEASRGSTHLGKLVVSNLKVTSVLALCRKGCATIQLAIIMHNFIVADVEMGEGGFTASWCAVVLQSQKYVSRLPFEDQSPRALTRRPFHCITD